MRPIILCTFSLILQSCSFDDYKVGDCAVAPHTIEVYKKVVKVRKVNYDFCVFEEYEKDKFVWRSKCAYHLTLRKKDFERVNQHADCPAIGRIRPIDPEDITP